MSAEPKKISFGFSKVSKKNPIIQPIKQNHEPKSDIQFIDCLEDKSIKLIEGEEKKNKELPIIPLLNGNLLRENIKEVIKSRSKNKTAAISENGNAESKEPLTLDEIAAKEILEDLEKEKNKEKEERNLEVPLSSQITVEKDPPSLEDYESMPISDYGLAMLRGMGWDPKKGIGLNGKIVTPSAPSLRPKGMGLGADKMPISTNISTTGEVLVMKKGAPVKIISGPHRNLYGKIEGFDELPGRIMVRTVVNDVIVSLNEIMVQLVSPSEFKKNIEQLGGHQPCTNVIQKESRIQKSQIHESLSVKRKLKRETEKDGFSRRDHLKIESSETKQLDKDYFKSSGSSEKKNRSRSSSRDSTTVKVKTNRYKKKKRRSSSRSPESSSSYSDHKNSRSKEKRKKCKYNEIHYENKKKYLPRHSKGKEFSSRRPSSSDSDDHYYKKPKKNKKEKRYSSTDSSSDSYRKSRKHKKYHQR